MDFSQYVKGNALKVSNTTINISKLVSFLQNNAPITKLSLKSAGIRDKEAEALAKLTNLIELDLEDNQIGDKGAGALANGNLSSLTELNLYNI
jgi:Leucine-rich repeat (LRR) protein